MDVWATSGDDIWAVGTLGKIFHFDGVTWSQVPSGTTHPLHEIFGRGADDLWAVGGSFLDGEADLLHWDGSSWRRVEVPFNEPLGRVRTSPDGDVWVTGLMNSSLFHLR
ncbi:MAG: hypothetical protein HY901_30875 [Deltaproteobacteria bacterium]|nr:hypothetical protein [Deltaproteobacteria bacterium]